MINQTGLVLENITTTGQIKINVKFGMPKATFQLKKTPHVSSNLYPTAH